MKLDDPKASDADGHAKQPAAIDSIKTKEQLALLPLQTLLILKNYTLNTAIERENMKQMMELCQRKAQVYLNDLLK